MKENIFLEAKNVWTCSGESRSDSFIPAGVNRLYTCISVNQVIKQQREEGKGIIIIVGYRGAENSRHVVVSWERRRAKYCNMNPSHFFQPAVGETVSPETCLLKELGHSQKRTLKRMRSFSFLIQ